MSCLVSHLRQVRPVRELPECQSQAIEWDSRNSKLVVFQKRESGFYLLIKELGKKTEVYSST